MKILHVILSLIAALTASMFYWGVAEASPGWQSLNSGYDFLSVALSLPLVICAAYIVHRRKSTISHKKSYNFSGNNKEEITAHGGGVAFHNFG